MVEGYKYPVKQTRCDNLARYNTTKKTFLKNVYALCVGMTPYLLNPRIYE